MTEYVPGNFMWSQGVMFAMEMMSFGGAAAGEVLGVVERLARREPENRAWWEEWSAEAERLERWGDSEAAAGHDLTAGSLYLRAATYYFCGERFLPPGEEKRATYERVLRCFSRGAAARYPNLERVEVPYEGATLPSYFLRSESAGTQPAPTMVVFDGLDNAKELSVLFAGVELARRGIHTLAIDGPGQGETLRLRGIPSRYDYEVPGTAAFEYVAARADVDPGRVGVMGFSLGGYYAPRAATFEKRYALCVAWGGHFDYHEAWTERRRRIESHDSRVSAPAFQLPWVLGVDDMDGAMRVLEDFRLDGVVQQLDRPLLVTHGEDDTVVPLRFARRLYEAAGSAVKELRVFTAAEGGNEHCQEDNRQIGANFVADWVADHI